MATEYLLLKMTAAVSPYLSGMVIFASAGILLAAGAGKQRQRPENLSYLAGALLVGMIGTSCNFLWLLGTRLTSAVNASTLGRLDIVFTLALAALLFGERISPGSWLFIGLSIAGATMISAENRIDISSDAAIGNLLIIAAAFMLSVNSFIIKKLSLKTGPMRLAAVNCAVNAMVFGTVWLLVDGVAVLAAVSRKDWTALLACGVCSFVFFSGYYAAIQQLQVWEVRLIALTAPLFTLLGGWLWLDEIISLRAATGLLLLLGGTAAVIIRGTYKSAGRTELCIQGV